MQVGEGSAALRGGQERVRQQEEEKEEEEEKEGHQGALQRRTGKRLTQDFEQDKEQKLNIIGLEK